MDITLLALLIIKWLWGFQGKLVFCKIRAFAEYIESHPLDLQTPGQFQTILGV